MKQQGINKRNICNILKIKMFKVIYCNVVASDCRSFHTQYTLLANLEKEIRTKY
jgi:hypothetical protein